MDGFSKDDFKGHSDYVNDVIILSLKLVSIPHSCPHMSGHCDVITPPIEFKEIDRSKLLRIDLKDDMTDKKKEEDLRQNYHVNDNFHVRTPVCDRRN